MADALYLRPPAAGLVVESTTEPLSTVLVTALADVLDLAGLLSGLPAELLLEGLNSGLDGVYLLDVSAAARTCVGSGRVCFTLRGGSCLEDVGF
ncbi:hypothetical protein [Paenibacillus sp. UMB4589-SE434]|uniref:hypothetical protein n=1 Tax=Paenibacillus sp. UMB4589-SE434 TaxID=3046314 RepID=UPI00254B7E76|nr:hypothetical protein [Paenibacillus sp. UMB4589-SE434]MDK8182434.1 hypothetical protein [Paenibacillus sp. UMB4589-SE434]